MIHETKQSKSVLITDSGLTFDEVYSKPYVTAEIKSDIKKANVLILPSENFRQGYPYLFPEYTSQFFSYLKENASEGLDIDICISDDDFKPLEMHSELINLPEIIVGWVAVPLLINLISSFLYDYIQRRKNAKNETKAKIKITVEEAKSKKVKTIEYEGDASQFSDAMNSAIEHLFD